MTTYELAEKVNEWYEKQVIPSLGKKRLKRPLHIMGIIDWLILEKMLAESEPSTMETAEEIREKIGPASEGRLQEIAEAIDGISQGPVEKICQCLNCK